MVVASNWSTTNWSFCRLNIYSWKCPTSITPANQQLKKSFANSTHPPPLFIAYYLIWKKCQFSVNSFPANHSFFSQLNYQLAGPLFTANAFLFFKRRHIGVLIEHWALLTAELFSSDTPLPVPLLCDTYYFPVKHFPCMKWKIITIATSIHPITDLCDYSNGRLRQLSFGQTSTTGGCQSSIPMMATSLWT